MNTISENALQITKGDTRMDFVYIANARFPTEKAHGLQIAKTIEALTRRHVNVTLVVPKRRVSEQLSPREFYSLSCEIKTIYLPCIDWFFLYAKFPSLGRFLYALETVTFLFSVTVYVLIRKPAIIYSRDPFLFTLLSFMMNNIFLELHTFPETQIGRLIIGWILRSAQGVIVINRFLRARVEKEGVKRKKILIAPNGADLRLMKKVISRDEARRVLGLPLEKTIIGYVGSLVTLNMEKGIKELILSTKRLATEKNNLICCIVGGPEGWCRNYESFAKKQGIQERVIFIGHVTYEKTPLFLQAMDILTIPFPNTSHFAYQASPLKLFEYMAARRPIVASDLPALREILNDESAVFVRPNDPQALAEGILRVLEDPLKAKSRANLAYALVKSLSWDNRARRIKMFIERLETHE